MSSLAKVTFSEYLSRLGKMCDSAKASLAAGTPLEPTRQKQQEQWWDGYGQALTDVAEAFYSKE